MEYIITMHDKEARDVVVDNRRVADQQRVHQPLGHLQCRQIMRHQGEDPWDSKVRGFDISCDEGMIQLRVKGLQEGKGQV